MSPTSEGESAVPVSPQAGGGEDTALLPSVSQATSSDLNVFEPEVMLEERDCSDGLLLSGGRATPSSDSLDRGDGEHSADKVIMVIMVMGVALRIKV